MVAGIGEDLKAKLKRSLKPARRLNATTDIWSSKQYRDSYLGDFHSFPFFLSYEFSVHSGVTVSFACPVDKKLKSLKIGKLSLSFNQVLIF